MELIKLAANEAGFASSEWEQAVFEVVFLGPRKTRQVNREFLGHDYVTDVITFDLRSGENVMDTNGCLGEILVCPVMALENASEFDKPPEWELTLYIVHGLLHLGGWDDRSPEDVRAMRKAENRVMRKLSKRFDLSECFEFESMSRM